MSALECRKPYEIVSTCPKCEKENIHFLGNRIRYDAIVIVMCKCCKEAYSPEVDFNG